MSALNWVADTVANVITPKVVDERPGFKKVWAYETDEATGRSVRKYHWVSDAETARMVEYELQLTIRAQKIRAIETAFADLKREFDAAYKADDVTDWRQWADTTAQLRGAAESLRAKMADVQVDYDNYLAMTRAQGFTGKAPR